MASPIFPNAPKDYDPAYMDQLLRVLTQGLNLLDVQKALLAGSASQTFLVAPATSGTMAPEAGQLLGRNLIVNGGCQVDQVNSGALVSPLIVGSYVVDNCIYDQSQTGKLSGQQIGGSMTTLGGYNSQRFTVLSQFAAAASDYFLHAWYIEGLNAAALNWGTTLASAVSLQFKVNFGVAGTYSGVIKNAASNRSYPFSYSVPIANTDYLIKIENIPGDISGTWVVNNTVSIKILFDMGSGSNFLGTAGAWAAANLVGVIGSTAIVNQVNTSRFDIGEIQLEKGAYCTTFERNLYSDVLRASNRYYQTSAGTVYLTDRATSATSTWQAYWPLPVQMRTTPTVVTTATGGTAGQARYNGTPANWTQFGVSALAIGGSFNTTAAGLTAGNAVSVDLSYTAAARL